MEENLNELLELIKNGKISIREASRKFGYSRDYLKQKLIEKYGENKQELIELENVLNNNKSNSTTIKIDSELMEMVFLKTINGEITLTEAREELGGIDIETLKGKFLKFIKNNEENKDLLLKYRNYTNSDSEKVDISKINFRVLAIRMIRSGISQTELATQVGVQPRTISREFEKFKNDSDKSLYNILKFYSDRMMKRRKFTDYEKLVMIFCLDSYERRHPELLSEDIKSKSEEKLERMQFLISETEKLKGQGLAIEEIASKLGTSISGLRRARIFIEEQNILRENKEIPKDKKDTQGSTR